MKDMFEEKKHDIFKGENWVLSKVSKKKLKEFWFFLILSFEKIFSIFAKTYFYEVNKKNDKKKVKENSKQFFVSSEKVSLFFGER